MKKLKVMVFGVFDLLHPGHVDFLKQARELGDYLVVSVARDVNVIRVKEQKPVHDEKLRIANLGSVPYVDKIVLGGLRDPWPHIVKEKPDVIALGYDQKGYVNKEPGIKNNEVRKLEEELHKHGLVKTKVVRLKPHWPEIYKSSKMRFKNF